MASPALTPLMVAAPMAAPAPAAGAARPAGAQPGGFAAELQQAVDAGGDADAAARESSATRGEPAGGDNASRAGHAARLRTLARAAGARGAAASADAPSDAAAAGAEATLARPGDEADTADGTDTRALQPDSLAPPPQPLPLPVPPAADGRPQGTEAPSPDMAAALLAAATGAPASQAAGTEAASPTDAGDAEAADTRPGVQAMTSRPAAGSDRAAAALTPMSGAADTSPSRGGNAAERALDSLARAAGKDEAPALRAAEPLPTAMPSFAGELARATQALASPAPAAATTELNLPTPVNAPDFVPRFSAEVAVLARDGIQEARVQVHPVELGPISVQITVDGSAAQVQLVVDNAQTHQLLEQSMPSLAAALRENGLTLTGGGVFQQAGQGGGQRQGSPSATPSGGRGGDAESDLAPIAAAPRRAQRVGALDLYA
jgi:flagellar hook-length control protein FliK